MKKIIVVLALVAMALIGAGCSKKAWDTEISSGDWTRLISSKGEVIYDGPKEYVDDEYERDALTESDSNWIWNTEKKEFDKVKRGSCTFNQ